MKSMKRLPLWSALLVSALAASSLAQGPVESTPDPAPAPKQETPPPPPRSDRPDLEEARRRWESLDPKERELIERRFEEYRSLSPEAREILRERARRFEERERRLREHAPPEERERLRGLPPEERARHWRERAIEDGRERGRFLRERLPPEMRRRLENAPPGERWRILEGIRERMRDLGPGEALRRLAGKLRLDPRRMEELRRLPPEERRAKMQRMHRELIERGVERFGLPPGVSPEDWKRVEGLPDGEFLERARTFLDRHFREGPGGPPHDRPGWNRPGERGPAPRDRFRGPGGRRDGPGLPLRGRARDHSPGDGPRTGGPDRGRRREGARPDRPTDSVPTRDRSSPRGFARTRGRR